MDSQIVIQTGQWKVKVILGMGGLATLIILAFLYRFEVGLILLALGGVGAVRLGFWAKNKHMLEQMQHRQLVAQTEAIELETSLSRWRVKQEQAIAQKMAYDALFIERKAGTFIVGDIPFRFYPTATASAQLATTPALALPSGNLDYFQVMSDPQQAYAIVGSQRIGKTILAQHLAQYLTRAGMVCVVVGTKAQPGEWLNCKRYIGNEAVPMALSSLLAEVKRRTEASVNTPKLAVFLDDWLNTVALDSALAEAFFLEAATRILTVGIVPYFLLQSDSKTDWGTKHGAQLKNNFVHLLLSAPRDNGRLNYNQLRGTVIYPGEKTQHKVSLPGGLPTFGDGEPDLELAAPPSGDFQGSPAMSKADEADAQFKELVESGESRNQAAMRAYGRGYGGTLVQHCRKVLGEI